MPNKHNFIQYDLKDFWIVFEIANKKREKNDGARCRDVALG